MNHAIDIPSGAKNPGYPVALNVAEKSEVVFRLIMNDCDTLNALRDMCTRHQSISVRTSEMNYTAKRELHKLFLEHECTLNCLVLRSEAELAGLRTDVPLHPNYIQTKFRRGQKLFT
jgi:hypothetical protein